ncbi:hypothetical protein AB4Y35_37765 [Paraburkholderia sp. EG286A]|uniref:hypothetical protein n=1 Tax=Paraburkholderia sp. EG286A TaxID=3237014 RepID=UPI0034D1BC03
MFPNISTRLDALRTSLSNAASVPLSVIATRHHENRSRITKILVFAAVNAPFDHVDWLTVTTALN